MKDEKAWYQKKKFWGALFIGIGGILRAVGLEEIGTAVMAAAAAFTGGMAMEDFGKAANR